MSYILAFDIGIKNLAFAMLNSETKEIITLKNSNILETETDPISITLCSFCKSKPKYKSENIYFCKKHLQKTKKPILHEFGTKLKNTELKQILKKTLDEKNGIEIIPHVKISEFTTSEKILNFLQLFFLIPICEKKGRKVRTFGLEDIHNFLRSFVHENFYIFKNANFVLFENQPVLKNPLMKTVQNFLYSILRDKYFQYKDEIGEISIPKFCLIHAKKKVQNTEKGDKGYIERKNKSQERILKNISENKIIFSESAADDKKAWEIAKKKSDMADALCMCIDFADL
jgi:hypothetical protein